MRLLNTRKNRYKPKKKREFIELKTDNHTLKVPVIIDANMPENQIMFVPPAVRIIDDTFFQRYMKETEQRIADSFRLPEAFMKKKS